ncbi:MAG: hypothetical protein V4592_19220 [Bacteroidota bacterium]
MKKFIIVLLFIAACKGKQANPVSIVVDKSHHTVKIAGLTETTLNGIKRDSLPIEAWQVLFPVFTMPADTDMRNYQAPLKGRYEITGKELTFTPDTLFKPGQTYFARYYRFDEHITDMDLVLHRRETGKALYTELIFKY